MKTNEIIEKKVIALHKEGWQVPNIASIARVKPDVVKQILREEPADVIKRRIDYADITDYHYANEHHVLWRDDILSQFCFRQAPQVKQ